MPATEQKDYYKILGVGRKASLDDIRKSYRKLARKYHPDVNPGDKVAEERFKNVQEAYDILKDPKKRQMYDQFGFYSEQGPFAQSGGSAREHPSQFDFGGFDFTDYFSREGGVPPGGQKTGNWGGFGDLFSQFFRPGAQGAARPQAQQQGGEDLEYAVEIGFWDAIRGTTVRLDVGRYEICAQCNGAGNRSAGQGACPECQGTGNVTQTVGAMKFNLTCPRCQGKGQLRNVCPGCGGAGRISRSDQVEVRIPAGAQDGSRLRVPGKGNAGSFGGPPGDLYIITRVGSHPLFERKGDDIHVRVPVTIAEAVLGAKIEVPTIDGRALLKIPPATDSGKTFRLREKGVLNRRTNRRGDQLVEVKIVVPKVPDESSKQMVRDFANLNAEDPRKDIWSQL